MRLRPTAPVIARTASSTQVGVHRPLVFDRVSAAEARFLGSLEGGRAVGVAEQRRHSTLLSRLDAAALLVHEQPPPSVVRFHHAGAIAIEAATALARLGWGIAFHDAARARDSAGRPATAPGSSLGVQASQHVRRAVPGARLRGADATADLDVLVTVGIPLTRAHVLLAADQPHLLICCDEDGTTVGPVITPGTGPCAQCLGLHATDEDALWPRIALQCEARRPRTDALTAGLAGMLAAAVTQDFIAGAAPRMWRVEGTAVTRLESRSPHPQCRCRAT